MQSDQRPRKRSDMTCTSASYAWLRQGRRNPVTHFCDIGHSLAGTRAFSMQMAKEEKVKYALKVAAAVLITASLALPLSATMHCLLKSVATRKQCMPCCQTEASSTQTVAQSKDVQQREGACCQISSIPLRGERATASARTEMSAPSLQVAHLGNTSASLDSQDPFAAVTPLLLTGGSHQSLLCTFLI